jgi:hypothetical protein
MQLVSESIRNTARITASKQHAQGGYFTQYNGLVAHDMFSTWVLKVVPAYVQRSEGACPSEGEYGGYGVLSTDCTCAPEGGDDSCSHIRYLWLVVQVVLQQRHIPRLDCQWLW